MTEPAATEPAATGPAATGAARPGPAQTSGRILTLVLEIPIRWGDMDAMGHVNNTVYFRYMEQARISWFDHLGIVTDPNGQGPVIINAACTFMKQFEYPGTVIARHYIGAIGRSSVETFVDMTRSDAPETVCASGSAKIVWVDFPRQKSMPLPDEVRALFRRPWADPIDILPVSG